MRIETLEPRWLLALNHVFGTDWIYLPATPDRFLRDGDAGGFTSMQSVVGGGSHTYKFLVDKETSYDVRYSPSGFSENIQPDAGKLRYVSWTVGKKGDLFDGTIFNAGSPVITVLSQWDEAPGRGTGGFELGPFLAYVDLPNRFDIRFEPALPDELIPFYKWQDQRSWTKGTVSQRNISDFIPGSTYLDVEVRDAVGRLYYKYDLIAYVSVKENLPLSFTWKDPFGKTYAAEDTRFIEDVSYTGMWSAAVSMDYIPTAKAYEDYAFGIAFISDWKFGQGRFEYPVTPHDATAKKLSGTAFGIDVAAFRDLNSGPKHVDYRVGLIAAPPKVGPGGVPTYDYSKRPFSERLPVETTKLPPWMELTPADVTYEETDVFGEKLPAYRMNIGIFDFGYEFPTTAGTPLGLLDGRKTHLKSSLPLTAYATVDFRRRPQVFAGEWSYDVELLGQSLATGNGGILPKSGVTITGLLEPHTLGIDGGGIKVETVEYVFAEKLTLAKDAIKGFSFTVPLFTTGAVTIDGKLEAKGSYEVIATKVAFDAQLLVEYRNGSLSINRDETFVRLTFAGSGKLEIDGKGSVGLSAGLSPPANLSEAEAKLLEDTRAELVQLVAEGLGEINLNGNLQANFSGAAHRSGDSYVLRGFGVDFKETLVTAAGYAELKYNACLFGDKVRDFLGLPACGASGELTSLGRRDFGPVVLLGDRPPNADPKSPLAFTAKGKGIGGPGVGSEGEEGDLLPSPLAEATGSMDFKQPFTSRLEQVTYDFSIATPASPLASNLYFVETVLTSGDESWLLDRFDLADLGGRPLGDRAEGSHSVRIPAGSLPDDRIYRLALRLVAAGDAQPDLVDVRITDLRTLLAGPRLILETASGTTLTDGIDFGPDTAGGFATTIVLSNDQPWPLIVDSVEVIGNGFELVDAPPSSRGILGGHDTRYRVRLTDSSRHASAILKVRSNDAEFPTREIALRYDGIVNLANSGPRVTSARLEKSSAASAFHPILSSSVVTVPGDGFDRLSITFDRSVQVTSQALKFVSSQHPELKISDFTYDPSTRVASWSLSQPLTAGSAAFTLLDSVTDLYGNRLDGEATSTTQPTGNGVAGGTTRLRFTLGGSAYSLPAAPSLSLIGNPMHLEGSELGVDPTAIPGQPGRGVVFALVEGPAYAAIDPQTGRVTWNPPETYNAGRYRFTIEASDRDFPGLASYRSFEVEHRKTNMPPIFAPVAPQSIDQHGTLVVYVAATDTDFPAQDLTYNLLPNSPAGTTIDPQTGELRWTLPASIEPGNHWIAIEVRDSGIPQQVSTLAIPITVLPQNRPPSFPDLPSPIGREHRAMTFQVRAIDSDSPPPTYRLAEGSAADATIDATSGIVTWTPDESDGGRSQAFYVEAIDGTDSNLITTAKITVLVEEVNTSPALVIPDAESLTVTLGQALEFDFGLIDTDDPATYKEYYLVATPAAGATVALTSGEFRWIPTETGAFEFTVKLIDYDFARTSEQTESFTISVLPDDVDPTLLVSLVTPTATPTLLINAADNVALESLTIRFLDPASDDVNLDPGFGIFMLSSFELAAMRGAEFEERTYTLEVRASDEAGNVTTTEQSFVVDRTSPDPAVLTLAPASDTFPQGDSRTQAAIVRLVGQAEPFGRVELFSTIGFDSEGITFGGNADASGMVTIDGVVLNHFGRNHFTVTSFDAAGNATTSEFSVIRLTESGIIGPIASGYRATRLVPGFADISATGNRVLDDGISSSMLLTDAELPGFAFDLFGQTYASVYLNLNGILSFGAEVSESPPDFLPQVAAVAPFWSSAFISEAEDGVHWQWDELAGGGRLTIQWQTQVTAVDGNDSSTVPVRFQVVLDTRTDAVEFHYDDLVPAALSLAERYEAVFIKGVGEQLEQDLAFVLAQHTIPFDLVDSDASTRIEMVAEPYPPLLRLRWSDVDAPPFSSEATIPGFPLTGAAFDHSRIESLEISIASNDATAIDISHLVGADGRFIIDRSMIAPLLVRDGNLVFNVTAIDGAGQQSVSQAALVIDTTAPLLGRIELDAQSRGKIGGMFLTSRATVGFVGTTEPQVIVQIEGADGVITNTVADDTGSFTLSDVPLEPGENAFKLFLFDSGGNVTSRDLVVTRSPDAGSPPDGYGYSAVPSTSGFVDISQTGHRLAFEPDQELATLSPAELSEFAWYFYGTEYRSLRVSSHGFLVFGDLAESDFDRRTRLAFMSPNGVIAPLADEFSTSDHPSTGVYWQRIDSADGHRLIVQWHEMRFSQGGDAKVSFQVVLNDTDGSISFHYASLQTDDGFSEGQNSLAGIKAPGDQEDVGWFVDLSAAEVASEYLGSNRSVRIDREQILLGPPRAIGSQPVGVQQTLDSLTIIFDRAMDRDSFSIADDVSAFTGPSGDLIHRLLGHRWLDAQTLRIDIVPQTANGTYSLKLKPTLESVPTGELIDQDADGLAGESSDDAIEIVANLVTSIGPDAAGYQAYAVAREAIDLRTGSPGVFVVHGFGDDEAKPVDLGSRTFRIYDRVFSGPQSLFVSTNGLISLGVPFLDYQPVGLDHYSGPIAILPYWTDWQIAGGEYGEVLGQFQEGRGNGLPDRLVLQWDVYNSAFSARSDVSTAVFQVIIELNTVSPGRIRFQYPRLEITDHPVNELFPYTVGITDGSGLPANGLAVAGTGRDSMFVGDGLAIEIASSRPGGVLRIDHPLRVTPASEVLLDFSHEISGLSISDFIWSRNGLPVSTAGMTVSGGAKRWTLHLPPGPQVVGDYELRLIPRTGLGSIAQGELLVTNTLEWRIFATNGSPSNMSLSNRSISAFQSGAIVGTLAVVDETPSEELVWTVSDPRFFVDNSQLRLVAGVALDWRFDREIPLIITVTDAGFESRSISETFTIQVLDAPRVPGLIQLNGATAKHKVLGALLGTVNMGDPDETEFVEWLLQDDRFVLVNGQVRLRSDLYLDQADDGLVVIPMLVRRTDAPEISVTRQLVIAGVVKSIPPDTLHNPLLAGDINADGLVSPLDALIVLNRLSQAQRDGIFGGIAVELLIPDTPRRYHDVDNSRRVEPLDALIVLNMVARNNRLAENGEGEALSFDTHFGSQADVDITDRMSPVASELGVSTRIPTPSRPNSPSDLLGGWVSSARHKDLAIEGLFNEGRERDDEDCGLDFVLSNHGWKSISEQRQ